MEMRKESTKEPQSTTGANRRCHGNYTIKAFLSCPSAQQLCSTAPLPGLLRAILALPRPRAVCQPGGFITTALFSLLHLQFIFPHQRGSFTAPAKRAAEGLSAHVTQKENMRCYFPLQPQCLFNPMQAGSIFKALLFL